MHIAFPFLRYISCNRCEYTCVNISWLRNSTSIQNTYTSKKPWEFDIYVFPLWIAYHFWKDHKAATGVQGAPAECRTSLPAFSIAKWWGCPKLSQASTLGLHTNMVFLGIILQTGCKYSYTIEKSPYCYFFRLWPLVP